MKIFKSNFEENIDLIKLCLNKCKFLSFDLEMTGINYDLITEANKYDSYQFRYKKTCEIVKKYEVVEVGLTFYLEQESKIGENLKNFNELNQLYAERTFTFTLLRNSKLKNIVDHFSANNKNNIFSCFSVFNPETHKFLNNSNFNFENLYKEGINYNKLSLREKIQQNLIDHLEKGRPSNSIFSLSKLNEKILLKSIIEIVKFLINKLDQIEETTNQTDGKKAKKKNQTKLETQKIYKVSNLPLCVINYLVSLNLKKITKLSQFNISRDKQCKNSIVVERSKTNLKLDDFLNEYTSLENFTEKLNIEIIKKHKFSSFINSLTYEKMEEILNDEMGFSRVIELIIENKPILVGHNILFDLMYIHEKFISNLPDSFYDYCNNIHKFFPYIYDTKYLIDKYFKEKDFDHTNLVYIYEKLIEEGYSNYVNFSNEIYNKNLKLFVADDTDKKDNFHNAGFDSLITGRCFVYIMKALENNYMNEKTIKKMILLEEKQKNKSVQNNKKAKNQLNEEKKELFKDSEQFKNDEKMEIDHYPYKKSDEKIIDKNIKENEKEITEKYKLKKGWIDFDGDFSHLQIEENNEFIKKLKLTDNILSPKFSNKIIFRNYEYPFNVIDFSDVENLRNKEFFLMEEIYKNLFIIIFKEKFLDTFEICNLIKNENFNYSLMKIDDNKCFIEFIYDEDNNQNTLNEALNEIKSNIKVFDLVQYEEFELNKFYNIFD